MVFVQAAFPEGQPRNIFCSPEAIDIENFMPIFVDDADEGLITWKIARVDVIKGGRSSHVTGKSCGLWCLQVSGGVDGLTKIVGTLLEVVHRTWNVGPLHAWPIFLVNHR